MDPIRFAFGVHLHQPTGNFDHVFRDHVDQAYLPFLQRVSERDFLPVTLHISGPLLEWLEQHSDGFLDLVGRLVSDGRVELLLAGFYEPILAALPRADRVEQIQWMREALERRFGITATGLWLTERVWEPDLPADLAEAGVRFVLVDDHHFLVSGFERHQIHTPWTTESDGKRVTLFPIDERLRYLVPFRPPEETAGYLRELRDAGHRLAVLADDGEKFGGWPGTREWVYERGWLDQFLDMMGGMVAQGEVQLTTFEQALNEVPSAGIAYLPTASYREMEGWALPPTAAVRLARLEHDLGKERLEGADGALVRGAHWRNFLAKYAEANRMHKKMMALSALCRWRGDPPDARRAIGRAQCNDAYWHGVFGGLYLPHLRAAVWHNLALAEAELRADDPLAHDMADFDADGHEEILIHSAKFSAVVSPDRGGVVEEYTLFETGINYADVLTRRREAYLQLAAPVAPSDGVASIEPAELAPVDTDTRALVVDRVLPAGLTLEAYERGRYQPVASWARAVFRATVEHEDQGIAIVLRPTTEAAPGLIEKRLRFDHAGRLSVSYRWDPSAFPPDAFFAPEISLARELQLDCVPTPDLWVFAIATVAKSERGVDKTVQGESFTPRWPVALGEALVVLGGSRE
ncbi:MAG TPA: alpha-amylase/4-alpha-glucanotransferase domain-containing protein [Gemmatimonadales bacterium]|nr:alpha-amylase/4-alpha-glucanotransferase domain-containing protein [Gemmatimonadales bacterium]